MAKVIHNNVSISTEVKPASAEIKTLESLIRRSNFASKYRDRQFSNWSDFEFLDAPDITYLLTIISDSKRFASHFDARLDDNVFDAAFQSDVAPDELIVDDFKKTANSKLLHTPKGHMLDLHARAIQGHAHERHSAFKNTRGYTNTTTLDVVRALHKAGYNESSKVNFDPLEFQRRSQQLIDDIMAPIEDFFNNPLAYKNPVVLPTQNGLPYAMNSLFHGRRINMIEFIRGFYFASQMDNFAKVRKAVHQKYKINAGGGECVPVSKEKLHHYNLHLKQLAHVKYQGHMELLNHLPYQKRDVVLRQLGVSAVIEGLDVSYIKPEFLTWETVKETAFDIFREPAELINIYIRAEKGQGVSDDTAIVNASFLPPTFTNSDFRSGPYDAESRLLGALAGDQVDTLEKDSHLIFSGGQDEMCGEYANARFRYLAQTNRAFREGFNVRYRSDGQYDLIGQSTLVDFVAASLNMETEIHSSQRWFFMEIGNTCAINEWLKFSNVMHKTYGKSANTASTARTETLNNGIFVTFKQLPIETVRKTMQERIECIHDPAKRQERLMNHINNYLSNA